VKNVGLGLGHPDVLAFEHPQDCKSQRRYQAPAVLIACGL
jgi:hypothetical protein